MKHTDDPALEKVREVRHRISEAADHDPQKIVDHYLALQKKYANRLIERQPSADEDAEPVKA